MDSTETGCKWREGRDAKPHSHGTMQTFVLYQMAPRGVWHVLPSTITVPDENGGPDPVEVSRGIIGFAVKHLLSCMEVQEPARLT